jgi:hypothetical protein
MCGQPKLAARVSAMPANADKQITMVVNNSMPPVRRRGDFLPSTGLAHHAKAIHVANENRPRASRIAISSRFCRSHTRVVAPASIEAKFFRGSA